MGTNGYETPEGTEPAPGYPGEPTRSRRRWGGAFVTLPCWLGAAGLLIAACARFAASGSGGVLALMIDNVGMMASHVAMASVVFAALVFALRRRGAGAVATLAGVIAFSGVLLAARAPFAGPGGVPANGPEGSVVRVLIANTLVYSDQPLAAADFLDAQDVDVAVVLETSSKLGLLFQDPNRPLRKRLPNAWVPVDNWNGYWYLFTRWTQTGGPLSRGYLDVPQMTICSKVERPPELGGPFLMIACHLFSPRTVEYRAEGNDKLRALVEQIALRGTGAGLPVLAGGDFNSSPTGWRSRELTRDAAEGGGGLLRAKPWWIAKGTRPGGMWPLSVAIDDVFASPGCKIVSWKTVEIPGSDHAGVVVEVWVPKGTTK